MELIEGQLFLENGFEAKLCEVAARASNPESQPLVRIDRCPGQLTILDEETSSLVIRGLINIGLGRFGEDFQGIGQIEADECASTLLRLEPAPEAVTSTCYEIGEL